MTPYATIFQSTLLVKKHSCATGGTPPLVMAAGGALSKSRAMTLTSLGAAVTIEMRVAKTTPYTLRARINV